MTSIVYNITYKEPPIDKKEALRYAGVRSLDACGELYESCLREVRAAAVYRVCYREVELCSAAAAALVGGSESVGRALSGCSRAIVFAATVGIGVDVAVRRAEVASPARAVMLGAIGTERVEALCDEFCRDMAKKYADRGAELRPRFSPGYGDLPLERQRDIFALLEGGGKIGLSLNGSLLMSPSKSVTAIIGIKDKEEAK